MRNYGRRINFGQLPRICVIVAILLVVGGCGQTLESAGSANDSGPASENRASSDEPIDVSGAPSDPPPNTETKKSTFDVSTFLDAALNGKIETIRQSIEGGVDVNVVDEQRRTALLFASFNGHTAVVKLLLEKGALLHQRDAAGRTALMFAATGDNAETVKFLLDAGAEVNAVDTGEQFTSLMHAAAEGQLEVVQTLLKYKADPDLRDVDGDIARDFAVQNGHSEVARLLTK